MERIEADGGSAAALQLDVADLPAFEVFVTQLRDVLRDKWQSESIHGLVNNAGIGGGAPPFAEVTEEMFDHFHRTLLKGPYFLTQQLLPLIEDGGVIVNTGSTSALDTGIEAGYSSYATSCRAARSPHQMPRPPRSDAAIGRDRCRVPMRSETVSERRGPDSLPAGRSGTRSSWINSARSAQR